MRMEDPAIHFETKNESRRRLGRTQEETVGRDESQLEEDETADDGREERWRRCRRPGLGPLTMFATINLKMASGGTGMVIFPRVDPILQEQTPLLAGYSYECNCTLGCEMAFFKKQKILLRSTGRLCQERRREKTP